MLRLPDELQSHLNGSSILSAGDSAKTSRRSGAVGRIEVDLVKGIEELASKLKPEWLAKSEILNDGKVRTDLSGSADEASPSIPVNAPRERVHWDEGIDVEKLQAHRIPVGVTDLHCVSRCAGNKLGVLIVVPSSAIQRDVSAHDDVQWRRSEGYEFLRWSILQPDRS